MHEEYEYRLYVLPPHNERTIALRNVWKFTTRSKSCSTMEELVCKAYILYSVGADVRIEVREKSKRKALETIKFMRKTGITHCGGLQIMWDNFYKILDNCDKYFNWGDVDGKEIETRPDAN